MQGNFTGNDPAIKEKYAVIATKVYHLMTLGVNQVPEKVKKAVTLFDRRSTESINTMSIMVGQALMKHVKDQDLLPEDAIEEDVNSELELWMF